MISTKKKAGTVATQIIDPVTVTLDDGTELACKPLKIKYLREFMNVIGTLSEVVNDDEKSLDILIDCCVIAFKQYAPPGKNKEELEEILDMPQIYRIIEGASGIVIDGAAENPQ